MPLTLWKLDPCHTIPFMVHTYTYTMCWSPKQRHDRTFGSQYRTNSSYSLLINDILYVENGSFKWTWSIHMAGVTLQTLPTSACYILCLSIFCASFVQTTKLYYYMRWHSTAADHKSRSHTCLTKDGIIKQFIFFFSNSLSLILHELLFRTYYIWTNIFTKE